MRLKFCNEFPGYVNIVNEDSVPSFKDSIPKEAEDQMRAFLRQVFPEFAERMFVLVKLTTPYTPNRRQGTTACHLQILFSTQCLPALHQTDTTWHCSSPATAPRTFV